MTVVGNRNAVTLDGGGGEYHLRRTMTQGREVVYDGVINPVILSLYDKQSFGFIAVCPRFFSISLKWVTIILEFGGTEDTLKIVQTFQMERPSTSDHLEDINR